MEIYGCRIQGRLDLVIHGDGDRAVIDDGNVDNSLGRPELLQHGNEAALPGDDWWEWRLAARFMGHISDGSLGAGQVRGRVPVPGSGDDPPRGQPPRRRSGFDVVGTPSDTARSGFNYNRSLGLSSPSSLVAPPLPPRRQRFHWRRTDQYHTAMGQSRKGNLYTPKGQ